MNDDRETLELAAKAIGLPVGDWLPGLGFARYDGGPNYHKRRWNSRTSPGDALELAVKLQINLRVRPDESGRVFATATCWAAGVHLLCGPDPLTTACEAITLAAAEIGRKMK